jgi:hypothetical protein
MKEDVFFIFQEATTAVGTSIKNNSKKIVGRNEGYGVCGE